MPTLTAEDEEDDNDGKAPYYCEDCWFEGNEDEFWPSDGDPAPHVCPRCGKTRCYPMTENGDRPS